VVRHGQSDSDILQQLNHVKSDARVARERVQYLKLVKSRPILEQYLNGDMALVLDVPATLNWNVIGRLFGGGPCPSALNFSSFVFQFNALNSGKRNDWGQQPMLVADVEMVNNANVVVPSIVRLYLACDKPKECGAADIYFSPMKRVYKFIKRMPDREFSKIADGLRSEPLNSAKPRIIESTLQIVDSISDDQPELFKALSSAAKVMFDYLIAATRIDLNGRNISIWQRGNHCLNIRDVLIGPFNLPACIAE